MVCSKRQVAMVTFFGGSDGDRGQLSSFIWLILSSLLPGYSTNKKTRKKKKKDSFSSSLERKQLPWKRKKNQKPSNSKHGKLFSSDQEFLNYWLYLETSTRPVNWDSFHVLQIGFFVDSVDPIIPALNNSPSPFQIHLVLFKLVCMCILMVTSFVSFAAWPSPSLLWWSGIVN